MFKGSWQTTLTGVLSAISTLWALVINPLVDGIPETNPDWGMAIPLILAALGLTAARDNKVSSEQAGAGKS